ncbi:hypothetical protein C0J52_06003 [Blattella germanica]|nr:hypothetical protein C0J52_06003 [Blattella germanica]
MDPSGSYILLIYTYKTNDKPNLIQSITNYKIIHHFSTIFPVLSVSVSHVSRSSRSVQWYHAIKKKFLLDDCEDHNTTDSPILPILMVLKIVVIK